MQEKISVIIPVYNVEKYISKCLDSIVNQTYKNIEIIIVNDGSTDRSGLICDEYAKRYNNIRVFHKENAGVSSARNLGIDNSSGEYIAFVDPDDYIDKNMYEILHKELIKSKSDISMVSFSYIKEEKIIDEDNSKDEIIFTKQEVLDRYFNRIKPFDSSFLWNKLFKKILFENVRLDTELVIQEDTEVLIRIFNKVNSIAYIGIPLYSYLIRKGAATEGSISKSKLNTDISLLKIYEYTEKNIPRYKSIALANYAMCYFNIIIEVIKNYEEYGIYYATIVKRLKKTYLKILTSKNIMLKYRFHGGLLLLNKNLYKCYIEGRVNK